MPGTASTSDWIGSSRGGPYAPTPWPRHKAEDDGLPGRDHTHVGGSSSNDAMMELSSITAPQAGTPFHQSQTCSREGPPPASLDHVPGQGRDHRIHSGFSGQNPPLPPVRMHQVTIRGTYRLLAAKQEKAVWNCRELEGFPHSGIKEFALLPAEATGALGGGIDIESIKAVKGTWRHAWQPSSVLASSSGDSFEVALKRSERQVSSAMPGGLLEEAKSVKPAEERFFSSF